MPALRHEVGAQTGDVAAAIADGAHRLDQAHDRLAGSGPADAIAAKQRDDLALAHRKIDALQDVALAVKGVQVADFEQGPLTPRSRPRYASCTARLDRISAGGPDAITLP